MSLSSFPLLLPPPRIGGSVDLRTIEYAVLCFTPSAILSSPFWCAWIKRSLSLLLIFCLGIVAFETVKPHWMLYLCHHGTSITYNAYCTWFGITRLERQGRLFIWQFFSWNDALVMKCPKPHLDMMLFLWTGCFNWLFALLTSQTYTNVDKFQVYANYEVLVKYSFILREFINHLEP